MPQEMVTKFNEKELHILAWVLSQVSNKTVESIFLTGKLYGLTPDEGTAVMDLYQRLMKEWEEWAKQNQ